MQIGGKLVEASVRHHRLVTAVVVGVTLVIALLAGVPSVTGGLGPLKGLSVDTDPENMLAADEPARVFNDLMRERLALHDIVVIGVVNTENPQGVFNAESLAKVYELTEYAKTLRWTEKDGSEAGVIEADIIAPSTVDNIEPVPGERTVRFSWLMPAPPADDAAAAKVLANAQRVPFFRGTMVPATLGDGSAVCVYLPIHKKKDSYRIYTRLQEKAAELGGPEEYHITGLPVAEDTFGVEMFVQMGIAAPAAMGVIFLLMLAFFRKLVLILSPLLVALASVVITMGLLVIAGFPIHIMSSMIPIFIMPIAVLDSIHIISEFFERYQQTRDRAATLRSVMDALFMPMLYTSLTSAAGFASLALTPIPPVQVFGVFVAGGIMVAWLLTVTFIPAFVMFIPAKKLANFGAKHAAGEPAPGGLLSRFLHAMGSATYRFARPIVVLAAVVLVVAAYGISRININDNPIKWFATSHPIRQADRVLNRIFGGTYMAYLAIEPEASADGPSAWVAQLARRARDRFSRVEALVARLRPAAAAAAATSDDFDGFFDGLRGHLRPDAAGATDAELSAWSALDGLIGREQDRIDFADPPVKFDKTRAPAELTRATNAFLGVFRVATERIVRAGRNAVDEGLTDRKAFLDHVQGSWATGMFMAIDVPNRTDEADRAAESAGGDIVAEAYQARQVFKDPAVLAHVKDIQRVLGETGIVGKSNSIVQIVETVNRDLHDGKSEYEIIPPNRKAVAECLVQFESGHRPRDLAHFVTTDDYRTASIWVQLTSGDNQDMSAVVAALDDYFAANARADLTYRWFGLTYINVVWQEKMVTGMLQAFAGSFLVVFLLMMILFRSVLWGLLCMVPLTVTIAAIYGVVGLVGKDYDMPVAILSSLTLGLSVDFAIHLLARARRMHAQFGDWKKTAPAVFGEPARAIARNIIVIAAGFSPLLLAPLVPYKTVGVLLATILLVSGVGTLLILPALVRLLAKRLFAPAKVMGPTCNCVLCIASSITLVALALTLHQVQRGRWGVMAAVSGVLVVVLAAACGVMSRRAKRRSANERKEAAT